MKDWIFDFAECGFPAGIFVIGFQIFFYLKEGEWLMLSLINGLIYIQKKPAAVMLYPDNWVGAHKFLQGTALSLSLIVLSIAWLLVFGYLYGKLQAYQERKEKDAQAKYQQQAEERAAKRTEFDF